MTPDEYKKQCERLAGFYAGAAETGREMQVNAWGEGEWIADLEGPCMGSDLNKWRLKPEPQKAWVVWYEDHGVTKTFVSTYSDDACRFAKTLNGTIQEITHPEPQ